MNWKSTAVVSGATLLATWLGWAPSHQVTEVARPAVPRESRASSALDIQDQARRLQSSIRTELEYRDPSRNLFRFAARPAVHASQNATIAAPVITPAASVVAPPFPYTLSGMAADSIDGQQRRTAILTNASEVLLVREGERIGNYVVTTVTETGVELTAADGTVHRLTLRP